ncbi:NAD/NADP octopine/nopaline dehydrogenase family protein [Radicibacter daui]|uniref:NAD/NADP octopine/nopaline dehydrogenase family protein n=1 Tax=Radicibacter daui TaxID=3064829 RepID=UPI004046B7FC
MSAAGEGTLRVAICGGGRTGHLNAVLFGQQPDVEVRMLTGNEGLVERHRQGGVIRALLPDGSELAARPAGVGSDPAMIVGDADIVLITQPANARLEVLRQIAPHLATDKPVFVGAIPGFCGFDWLAEHVLGGRDNVVIWGMKDVPHTAFELVPGRSIRMGGAKSLLHVATHDRQSAQAGRQLQGHLARLYEAPVELLKSYLEITLTPGNPIMHSSVIYGLIGPYGQWSGRAFTDPLCWWSDCPEIGAYFLERCDAESQALCKSIEDRLKVDLSSVRPLKDEIVDAYGDQIADPHTMLSVLRTNRAYAGIRAPLVEAEKPGRLVMDRSSRAFQEDIAFGLALLVEMGRRMAVSLPHIEEIFAWSVAYMGGLKASSLDYFPAHWPVEESWS